MIYISNIVVETDSMIAAAKVAAKAVKKDAVRGKIKLGNIPIRWSTIQQYEYHGGFTPKRR